MKSARNLSVDRIGRSADRFNRAKDAKKYDHVADILNRIESRIDRKKRIRNTVLGERVSKLSKDNDFKDRMNRSWHSAW